jgi:hypothetical protein
MSAINPAPLPDQTPPFWTDVIVPSTIEDYGGFAMGCFAELPFSGGLLVEFFPDTVQWTPIDTTQTA